jgi:hypothetical protein
MAGNYDICKVRLVDEITSGSSQTRVISPQTKTNKCTTIVKSEKTHYYKYTTEKKVKENV